MTFDVKQRSFSLSDFGVRKILIAQIHQKKAEIRFHLLFKAFKCLYTCKQLILRGAQKTSL